MRKIINYDVIRNPNVTSVDIEALNVPAPGTHTTICMIPEIRQAFPPLLHEV